MTETLSIALNFDPKAVLSAQQEAFAESLACQDLTITSDAEQAVVAEYLREKVLALDAVEALQKSCADPIYKAWKSTRAIFDETITHLKTIRKGCDAALGAYRLSQIEAQRQALAIATVAATAGDLPTMTTALQVANTAPTKAVGVAVRASWHAEVIAPDLLPTDWTLTVPNIAKINAHAARFAEHETPHPVPGIRFVLVADGTRVSR